MSAKFPVHQAPAYELERCIFLLDQLNAQVGFCGAAMAEKYYELKKKDFLNRYAEQIPMLESSEDAGEHQSRQRQEPTPIVQDHASLTNVLTQIQHDLFYIRLKLSKPTFDLSDYRIDEESHAWLTDMTEKISATLPEPEEKAPILPIGNTLATSLFMAHNLCQQVSFQLELVEFNNQQTWREERQYLKILDKFLLLIARWTNLVHGERDWFWKPKSETQPPSEEHST